MKCLGSFDWLISTLFCTCHAELTKADSRIVLTVERLVDYVTQSNEVRLRQWLTLLTENQKKTRTRVSSIRPLLLHHHTLIRCPLKTLMK